MSGKSLFLGLAKSGFTHTLPELVMPLFLWGDHRKRRMEKLQKSEILFDLILYRVDLEKASQTIALGDYKTALKAVRQVNTKLSIIKRELRKELQREKSQPIGCVCFTR